MVGGHHEITLLEVFDKLESIVSHEYLTFAGKASTSTMVEPLHVDCLGDLSLFVGAWLVDGLRWFWGWDLVEAVFCNISDFLEEGTSVVLDTRVLEVVADLIEMCVTD